MGFHAMENDRIRVVLDTNLFAAARWNPRSASARIIEACLRGRFRAYYSEQIRREMALILRNIRTGADFAAKVRVFLDAAVCVEPSGELKALPYVEDREDAKFLACALAADADYLITSDEHLLRVGNFGRTSVVKPSAFLREAMEQR